MTYKMTPKLLKYKNVKSITDKGSTYFDIVDIKKNHPDLKIDTDKVTLINNVKVIKAKYVSECTELDKNIKNVFKKKI